MIKNDGSGILVDANIMVRATTTVTMIAATVLNMCFTLSPSEAI